MNNSKKVLLCGYFAFGTNDFGGQPVKAREMFYALQELYGENNVHYVETLGWKRRPLKLIKSFFSGAISHNRLIMIPAHNGLKVFSRLLWLAKKFLHKKIYYSVVGGWLAETTKNQESLKIILKDFDGILVETSSMKNALEAQGFTNVTVIPNFKALSPVEDIKTHFDEPLPLCTFSRVMEEKGIQDAIDAVTKINKNAGQIIYSLDIYGQIYEPYAEKFSEMQKTFPDFIKYKGVIPSNESVNTIKNYYALLFPTHFYTEGIPGTLIDAIFAGVPVITSLWVNSGDIFQDGVTGWGYEFGQWEKLEFLLKKAYTEKEEFLKMRHSSIEKVNLYKPEKIARQIDVLIN